MFDKCLEIILKLEGGYSNDPNDPGQETNHGITVAVARQFGYTGDMKDIPMSVVKAIYKDLYWDEVRGDELPYPLCLYMFDCAVNQGPSIARKLLQRTLEVPQDGIIGNNTMMKIKNSTPWHWAKFMAYRAQRYMGTRNYDLYGVGWLTRLFTVAKE